MLTTTRRVSSALKDKENIFASGGIVEKTPKSRRPLAPINTNTINLKENKNETKKSEERRALHNPQKIPSIELAHEDPPRPYCDETVEAVDIPKYLEKKTPILPTYQTLMPPAVLTFETEDFTETTLAEDPVSYTVTPPLELSFDL